MRESSDAFVRKHFIKAQISSIFHHMVYAWCSQDRIEDMELLYEMAGFLIMRDMKQLMSP